MRTPITISILITGNLLLGQIGVNPVNTSEFYTSGNESFAAQTAAHEQQLYAEQMNNWAGQSQIKHHRTNTNPIQVKTGTLCSVSLTNGMTLTGLKIQKIDGHKLIVVDRNGSFRELFLSYVSSIEIHTPDQSSKSGWKQLATSVPPLNKLFNIDDTITLQLGWLSVEDKIATIESTFLAG